VRFVALQQGNGMNRRKTVMIALLAGVAVAATEGPQPIAQFGRWGVFRASDGASCYAIAQPERVKRDSRAALIVSTWPNERVSRHIQVRFRKPAEDGATLTIGGRRFPLTTKEAEGWPVSAVDERQIARLLRERASLRVATRNAGRRVIDDYPLSGAASAIDAADLACLREKPGR
jgi:hypothetical protein